MAEKTENEEGAAPSPKVKEAKRKGKRERTGRKHESLKVWEYYEVKDGVVTRKRKHCPRCGPGTSLSEHKDRSYCGRCGYTEFRKEGGPAAEPAEPKEENKPAPEPEKEEQQPKEGAAESEPEKKEDSV
ncbi:MAG: 30S ribosomal protein S27ae [Candidatus Aenigmatarchaeota archaeon]|nr:MAG: 30S ribosomal protein S27ae [Candidatus Aenigmarchaeota archaeon]